MEFFGRIRGIEQGFIDRLKKYEEFLNGSISKLKGQSKEDYAAFTEYRQEDKSITPNLGSLKRLKILDLLNESAILFFSNLETLTLARDKFYSQN